MRPSRPRSSSLGTPPDTIRGPSTVLSAPCRHATPQAPAVGSHPLQSSASVRCGERANNRSAKTAPPVVQSTRPIAHRRNSPLPALPPLAANTTRASQSPHPPPPPPPPTRRLRPRRRLSLTPNHGAETAASSGAG